MSLVDVISPANEDGTTATVLRWLKAVGEPVERHEPLLELETDKVTVEVPAPASGVLEAILVPENHRIEAGVVLARIAGADATAAPVPLTTPANAQASTAGDPKGRASTLQASNNAAANKAAASLVSPAVRRLAAERGVDLDQLRGTGLGGRVTARDLEALHTVTRSHRIPHSIVRRRIAERMAHSMATAPHVTTVFEADLSPVLADREVRAAEFAARGTRLTLSAYFVAASVAALRAVPEANASFHADALELHEACNIGIGTALPDGGLIVPVLRDAETLDLFGIATGLARLAAAARANALDAAELRGGTFTISNHGVSGSLLAAPIVIVQPQVAILGVGKLTRRPVVIGPNEDQGEEERLVIRPMCYVTLTIDHRALDGSQANAFLSTLVRALEQWPPPAQ